MKVQNWNIPFTVHKQFPNLAKLHVNPFLESFITIVFFLSETENISSSSSICTLNTSFETLHPRLFSPCTHLTACGDQSSHCILFDFEQMWVNLHSLRIHFFCRSLHLLNYSRLDLEIITVTWQWRLESKHEVRCCVSFSLHGESEQQVLE